MLAAEVAIAVSHSPESAAARGVVEQGQRDADDDADNLAAGLLIEPADRSPVRQGIRHLVPHARSSLGEGRPPGGRPEEDEWETSTALGLQR